MTNLKDLLPSTRQLVIDVVAAAGIDTNEWKTKTDPSRRSNWSFGGNGEPTLVLIWHGNLREDEKGQIYYVDKSKEWAIKTEREGAKLQARRAHDFHGRLNRAYFANLPVRVAIVDGKTNDDTGVAEADARELDNEYWYTHHFNENTSEILLVRGIPRPQKLDQGDVGNLISEKAPNTGVAEVVNLPELSEEERAIETSEFANNSIRKYVSKTAIYARDSEVSLQAKIRSNGMCECCGEQGFETVGGGSYLEAHHVIPLASDGLDEVWNVVAICPNDHKRAHFGKDRMKLRDKFVNLLIDKYQDRKADILTLVMKMDTNLDKEAILEDDSNN